ncbi:hypothetical protein PpBr36_08996 [Pyricularia pennisetigena]|uniref:hypothetical protein n=1 Tax=Pyricularia pennisetigena TaxID=1578925 RepID=UPI00115063FB|nr:hypothetical protein PpBr36_08996 [Pyricularia pennisetigena]TLS23862.1 hypothetical protein PpBr36_08996 [Pyricularia pennisetigena]
MAKGRCRPRMMTKPVAMDCEFVSCPITALAFFEIDDPCTHHENDDGCGGHGREADAGRTYLLAGEDTQLKIYDVASGSLCGELQVFSASVIHGIFVGSGASRGSILVWGGCSAAVIPRALLEDLLSGEVRDRTAPAVTEATAPDWIYDGALAAALPSGRGDVDGFLVTAHNEVVELRIASEHGHPRVEFGRIASPSRPILYSANVRLLAGDVILVAGGTVFGEIIVWNWHPIRGDCEVLFVLEGHEGSIFGVHVSDELITPSGDSLRLLASCSDDRTVRIWDITVRSLDPSSLGVKSQNGKLVEEGRETGFGGKKNVDDETQAGSMENLASAPTACSRRALAVAMGHMSRIWHVKFSTQGLLPPLGQDAAPRMTVYSFGEDATMQEWLLDLPGESSGTLSHVKTTPCHSGKHIWSTALLASTKPRGRPLIATGGSDGKISLIGDFGSRKLITDDDISRCPDIDADTGLDHTAVSYLFADFGLPADAVVPAQVAANGGKGGRGAETFKTFAFASQDELLVTSTLGNLFLGKVLAAGDVSWSKVTITDAERSDLKNYNIVRGGGDSGHRISFIGSATGAVYMFTAAPIPRLLKVADLGRKISDIFPLSRGAGSPESMTSLFGSDGFNKVVVTLLGHEEAYLISIADIDLAKEHIPTTQITSIPLSSGFVVTAANICNDSLVLGTRDGNLVFYRHSKLEGGRVEGHTTFHEVLQATTTSKDAITSVVPLPGAQGGAQCPYALATCRDGKYMIYEITTHSDVDAAGPSKGDGLQIKLIHESCPPFGPIIAEAWFKKAADSGDLELILCGFRSRYFVVWNETWQHEIATVDCGGAHRTFAYTRTAVDGPDDWVRFAYIKAQRTHIHTQRRAGHTALRNGMHGREVRAASWCGDLLATAAEDTTVRIWKYPQSPGQKNTKSKEMRCVACLNVHTAGLQSLQWCGPGYLVSSAGNEELFVWRVSRLDDRSAYAGGLAVVREAVYPDRTPDGDLRIVDVAVHAAGDRAAEDSFFISIVLSNSVLRSYLYSKEKGFDMLAQGRYTGVCLTQIRHLEMSSGHRLCVLTASTDGAVVVWECAAPGDVGDAEVTVAREYIIREVYDLHQSSIKGLDVGPLQPGGGGKGGGWAVLTVGDDNALSVLYLLPVPDGSDDGGTSPGSRSRRATVRSAHAAGITGIRIVGSRDQGRVLFAATISNDQRVKIWRVQLGSDVDTNDRGAAAVRVQLLQDRYSAVADAGDLDLWEGENPDVGGKLVVAGVGVEVWGVSLS